MKSALIAAGLLLAIGTGCAAVRGVLGSGRIFSVREAPQGPYRVRPGDQLEITVPEYLETSRKVLVAENGSFLFSGIGEIHAAERSLQQIEETIQKGLQEKYASSPPSEEQPSPESQQTVSPREIPEEPYRLRPGDRLAISVWNHEGLDQEVTLQEDGNFSYPLIGEVQAKGRSLKDVEREIVERLDQDYVVNPQVTVALKESVFSVLGQVAKPGSYSTDGTVDLLTAIGMAGGVPQAGGGYVEVIRIQEGKRIAIRADTNQILLGQEPNIKILPHDTIHVRSSGGGFTVTALLVGARFTVLGEVGRPGSYPIEGTLDLLTAVSQAGGIGKFGSSAVEIIREQGENRWVVRADLNRILQGKDPNPAVWPHDTIHVRRRLI